MNINDLEELCETLKSSIALDNNSTYFVLDRDAKMVVETKSGWKTRTIESESALHMTNVSVSANKKSLIFKFHATTPRGEMVFISSKLTDAEKVIPGFSDYLQMETSISVRLSVHIATIAFANTTGFTRKSRKIDKEGESGLSVNPLFASW